MSTELSNCVQIGMHDTKTLLYQCLLHATNEVSGTRELYLQVYVLHACYVLRSKQMTCPNQFKLVTQCDTFDKIKVSCSIRGSYINPKMFGIRTVYCFIILHRLDHARCQFSFGLLINSFVVQVVSYRHCTVHGFMA